MNATIQERAAAQVLCLNCVGKVIIHACGTCRQCGNHTATVSHKMCRECAKAASVCRMCGLALRPYTPPPGEVHPDGGHGPNGEWGR